MQIFKTVSEIQEYLTKFNTKTVGFVATMGALHEAHISLLKVSQKALLERRKYYIYNVYSAENITYNLFNEVDLCIMHVVHNHIYCMNIFREYEMFEEDTLGFSTFFHTAQNSESRRICHVCKFFFTFCPV